MLQPLPPDRFQYGQWLARQTVPKDYHVSVMGHYYSVPFTLVGKPVEARVTPTTVEVHCNCAIVATHGRSSERGGVTTKREHQPKAHRAEAERNPDGLLLWAGSIGCHMEQFMAKQFQRKNRFEGLPAATAIRDLAKHYTPEQLEAGAARVLELRLKSATDLKHQLRVLAAAESTNPPPRVHQPVRAPVTPRRGAASPHLKPHSERRQTSAPVRQAVRVLTHQGGRG